MPIVKKVWLILFLLLASCTVGNASPTSTPPSDKPPTISPSQAMDVGSVKAGQFKAVVDGVVQHDFEGTGLYVKMDDGSLFLTLTNMRDVKNATISIILPPGMQPGKFTLNPYESSLSGETNVTAVAAGFSVVAAENSGNLSDMYTRVTSGTLTLQTIEPITGTFQFTAQDGTGRTVTVSGAFNQVPLSEP